jgi:hypothetical protein
VACLRLLGSRGLPAFAVFGCVALARCSGFWVAALVCALLAGCGLRLLCFGACARAAGVGCWVAVLLALCVCFGVSFFDFTTIWQRNLSHYFALTFVAMSC